jgi:hypothetical protein
MTAKKTAKKPKAVTFVSRFPDYTLIRVAPDYEYNVRGQIVGTQKPEPDESPWRIDFTDSLFTTDDPVLLEFIREHEEFNRSIWEQGAAPDEPKPTHSDQMQAISTAAAYRDIPAIEAVVAEEEKTHNRAAILLAAEAAIEAIESVPTEVGGTSDNRQKVIASTSANSEQD